MIYRGPRLVNWSPTLQTAVSDLEVEHTEEKGKLYYFKYQLVEDPDQFIPVATTRPETILADTAVAVHPDDDRYKKYIGKMVLVPILGREIPVIGDEYVSVEFGTGALKITPGHDPNDYEIGLRHNLELLSMLDKKAKVTEVGGPYEGQDRFEARKNLRHDMKDYALSSLAKICLGGDGGVHAAGKICQNFLHAIINYKVYLFDYPRLLGTICDVQPYVFLDIFIENNQLKPDQRRRMFTEDINDRIPIDRISDEVLITWCEKAPEKRYNLIASAIRPFIELSEEDGLKWRSLNTPHPTIAAISCCRRGISTLRFPESS